MAMVSSTLANQLLNLNPVSTEAAAITTLANAYAAYAGAAVAGAQPLTAAGVALGKAAMTTALAGISVPGAGAAKLVAGIQAFWGAVAIGLTTSFVGAVAITPPPHAGLLALLSSTFASNVASKASKANATSAIASNCHSQAVIGGTVTYAGPVVSPIL